jgi:hypothetical protein
MREKEFPAAGKCTAATIVPTRGQRAAKETAVVGILIAEDEDNCQDGLRGTIDEKQIVTVSNPGWTLR